MLVFPMFAGAIDTHDTRMLSQPAVSADHIAFIYAEDLWVANLDGSEPRRLTVSEGIESSPVFSPDGKWIAFSAQYDGNMDVYIIPVEGGIPKRLTWHPGCGCCPRVSLPMGSRCCSFRSGTVSRTGISNCIRFR